MTTRRHLVIVAAGVLALAACGGGDDDDSSATTTPTSESSEESEAPETTEAAPETTAPATTTATTEPGINSFDQVQPAVIQILATGTIRDPEIGMATQAGSGTGFIISPDGLAVTNNHVVTGAATLEVFIGGDTTKSYNASVVGVSECNDLALVKIANADDLPVLTWQESDPTVGQEVYAAGFPLGDPEFTMTRGIVAKAQAAGDTPWASIDYTLEHDANIQPGNSGGPLIATDGKVVAVNYADLVGDEHLPVLRDRQPRSLRTWSSNCRTATSSRWGSTAARSLTRRPASPACGSAGVAPGSPVSEAGVLPGDIVTALNGLPLGADGTMKDYCDVLRTAGPARRSRSRCCATTRRRFCAASCTATRRSSRCSRSPRRSATSTPRGGDVLGLPDTGRRHREDHGRRAERVDRRDHLAVGLDDGTENAFIQASTDNEAFDNTWDVPGLFYAALAPTTDIPGTIALVAPGADQCTTDNGVTDYDDGVFTGQYQYWSGCGGSGAEYVVLVANPGDASYTAVIAVQILSDADWEALDKAFATFNVVTA